MKDDKELTFDEHQVAKREMEKDSEPMVKKLNKKEIRKRLEALVEQLSESEIVNLCQMVEADYGLGSLEARKKPFISGFEVEA